MTDLGDLRKFGKPIKKDDREYVKIGNGENEIRLGKGFKADPRMLAYYGMVVDGKLILMERVEDNVAKVTKTEQWARLIRKAIAQGGILGIVRCKLEPTPLEFMPLEDYSDEEDEK